MSQPPNYSNLHFAPQVQWPTDPGLLSNYKSLLAKINGEAKRRGQTVDIISGYRPKDYNTKIGGASNSNHIQGKAIDAYINSQPIGEVWDSATFKRLGLRSGNQPNFFHGKSDPEHVDMGAPGGGSDGSTGSSGGSGTSGGQTSTGGDPNSGTTTAGDLINSDLAGAEPTPGGPVVGVNLPGLPGTALGRNNPTPQQRYETWQMLSQLPGASADTQNFAQLAGFDNAGA